MKNILIFLLLSIGLILLQIYLSKKISRFYGLILPSLTFILSIFTVLNLMLVEGETLFQFIIQVIYTLLLCNLPTFLFLVIYYHFHQKNKR